ncbi:polysaccharide pyruvyl transferase family protein [Enterococcus casseliflavus]|uniref:polysaccharide pyruvyl transferase family protein n=1 Tax=Enterococcus casseliflavus TaxID=37734 RepID=UPI0007640CFF|nr:polysaccharide pyruvyl transferase family protein [Enterococcus casseliflavus]OJG28869.1 capsular exopolysaccharide biosynthesis protein (Wzm) [Enterococcus casseliflavus]QQU22699.1 polysaccharide pyruvyl transferase family protein [Enterococcus casseliflavus]STQ30495.1 polysaccharide pyruvyl transferase CsaB [Enterococcus casseliflavus]
MKKVLFFDTSVGTLNIGDEIINKAINEISNNMFKEDYIMKLPSRTGILNKFQLNYNKSFKNNFCNADLKFVCGTNLLYKNMLRPMPNWNINLLNTAVVENSILFGVGSGNNAKKITNYTKILYKKVLSKDYIHSVRDQATKNMLDSIGIDSVVTGCPTLWQLNEEKNAEIPFDKSETVVFTLTHYQSFRNFDEDKAMIVILRKLYKDIYFWPQSLEDLDYLNQLGETAGITILSPNLVTFDKFLTNNHTDYVGTRLHGGIFAMQHGRRSVILAIDNRAREIKKNNNIPCIERDETSSELENLLSTSWKTSIIIEDDKIEKWKQQFI